MKTKDVALVLSSGGPRGFAYIGAIEELEARGYSITSVAGSSIGSLVGGIYAAGKLPEFKEWLFSLNNFKLMRLLDFSINKRYVLKGMKVMEAIESVVPNVKIEDLRIPYVAVGTDLYTGEPVAFRKGKLFDAIRASISIPSLFMPSKNGWRTFVDGGLVSTFPLEYVQRNGHDILVGFDVNVTDTDIIEAFLKSAYRQRQEAEKSKSEARDVVRYVSGLKDISMLEKVKLIGSESQRMIKKALNSDKIKSPVSADDNYFSIITRSFAIANHTIAKLETRLYPPDILVQMSFDSYGAIPDYAKGNEISEKGRMLMAEALDKYEKEHQA